MITVSLSVFIHVAVIRAVQEKVYIMKTIKASCLSFGQISLNNMEVHILQLNSSLDIL